MADDTHSQSASQSRRVRDSAIARFSNLVVWGVLGIFGSWMLGQIPWPVMRVIADQASDVGILHLATQSTNVLPDKCFEPKGKSSDDCKTVISGESEMLLVRFWQGLEPAKTKFGHAGMKLRISCDNNENESTAFYKKSIPYAFWLEKDYQGFAASDFLDAPKGDRRGDFKLFPATPNDGIAEIALGGAPDLLLFKSDHAEKLKDCNLRLVRHGSSEPEPRQPNRAYVYTSRELGIRMFAIAMGAAMTMAIALYFFWFRRYKTELEEDAMAPHYDGATPSDGPAADAGVSR